MERELVIQDLNTQLEALARMHILHGLSRTEGFKNHMERINATIETHGIDVRQELDPMSVYLYRRYFD